MGGSITLEGDKVLDIRRNKTWQSKNHIRNLFTNFKVKD